MRDMVTTPTRHPPKDVRDRVILTLYAQLQAERQTRETLVWVIRNGGLSPEVLDAIGEMTPARPDGHAQEIENVITLTDLSVERH